MVQAKDVTYLKLDTTKPKGYYLQVAPRNGSCDFEVDTLKDHYHLVTVKYSEGNTSGTPRKHVSYCHLAETPAESWAVANAIVKHYEKYHHTTWNPTTHNFLDHDFNGKKIRIETKHWSGWFDEIEEVEIVILGVKR